MLPVSLLHTRTSPFKCAINVRWCCGRLCLQLAWFQVRCVCVCERNGTEQHRTSPHSLDCIARTAVACVSCHLLTQGAFRKRLRTPEHWEYNQMHSGTERQNRPILKTLQLKERQSFKCQNSPCLSWQGFYGKINKAICFVLCTSKRNCMKLSWPDWM